jgi:long-chain acyl-CoA synthetase
MITGMAPIKRSTLELFALMRLPLYETYGLVEAGSIAINVPGAWKLGSVGRVIPGIQIDIAEDGELIIRREHTMAVGYFECAPGESERTFIGDNQVATGDIGRFDEEGFLYLLGRKKEIIVTAGGEKLHPEALEAEIDACPDVAKSVVFTSHDSPVIMAVVLPKAPQDAEAKARIERFVGELGARRPSKSVGRVIFTDLVFSRENGFLRPNLKLDRKKIAAHFQPQAKAAAA